MLRDRDSFAILRAKRLHGCFEQQMLADHRVQHDLPAAVVVTVDLVQPNVDLLAVVRASVFGAEEHRHGKVDIERHVVQATRACGGKPARDVSLYEHVHAASLGVHLQAAITRSRPELSVGERGRQPVPADGKVPILPGLVEVLDL